MSADPQLRTTAVPLTLCYTVSVRPVMLKSAIMANCYTYKGPLSAHCLICAVAIHILLLHAMPLDHSPPQVAIMCAGCARLLLRIHQLPRNKNVYAFSL